MEEEEEEEVSTLGVIADAGLFLDFDDDDKGIMIVDDEGCVEDGDASDEGDVVIID